MNSPASPRDALMYTLKTPPRRSSPKAAVASGCGSRVISGEAAVMAQSAAAEA